MNKQKQINYIMEKISYWSSYIKLCNKESYTDINHISEGFVQQLLNIIYDVSLVNLNNVHVNYPGLDLGDLEKGIGIQVTSRRDSKKIEETYKKIFSTRNKDGGKIIGQIFNKQILFIILSPEDTVKFNKKTLDKLKKVSNGKFTQKDIINISELLNKIISLFDENNDKFQKIYNTISTHIDKLPVLKNDSVVVEEILSCFNRPAFTVEFSDECNLADFEKALKNTISLINTGKDSEGIIKTYNVNDIASKDIKLKFSEVVNGINKLRKIFCEMQFREYVTSCKCGNSKCKVIYNKGFEVSCMMNDLRTLILNYVSKISVLAGCDILLKPLYYRKNLISLKYDKRKKSGLCNEMSSVYEYYNKFMEK